MKLLEWGPIYQLGIEEVDGEHRRMIADINEFYEKACAAETDSEAQRLLVRMLFSVSAHFKAEDDLMKRQSWPGFSEHQADHQAMLDRLREIIEVYVLTGRFYEELLEHQLSSWFVQHFQSHDLALATAASQHCRSA